MRVFFSVLNYKPSFITNESINVGILFHNKETDQRVLELTAKWSRIKSFDDELDIEYFRILLEGINNEVSNDLFNRNVHFDIYKYTKQFVNELQFAEIVKKDTDDFKKFVSQTKKMFLRYDFQEKDRPNQKEQLKYIKEIMKDNKIKYGNGKAVGTFFENIKYDYTLGNYAFKLFTFKNKEASRLVSSAKAWALTAKEMSDKKDIKTIFIYDHNPENSQFNIIYEILNNYSFKVMKIDEALEFIMKETKYGDELKQENLFTISK